MIKKKCSLCGGNLVNNRCTFCGLDNSIYDREHSRRQSISSQPESLTEGSPVYQPQSAKGKQSTTPRPHQKTAAQKPKAIYPRRQTNYSSAARRTGVSGKRRGWMVWIIIIVVILLAALPALTDFADSILGKYRKDILSPEYGGGYPQEWNCGYSRQENRRGREGAVSVE